MADQPVKTVFLKNTLSQSLSVSVDRGNGPEEIILPPNGTSAPVADSQLTDYTRGLVEQGRIRLRSAQ